MFRDVLLSATDLIKNCLRKSTTYSGMFVFDRTYNCQGLSAFGIISCVQITFEIRETPLLQAIGFDNDLDGP